MFTLTDFRGYYTVGPYATSSKLMAWARSNQTPNAINWHYHDDVWAGYAQHRQLHPQPLRDLDTLYRDRAQQLRDKYDYLILNYSGGADSWNVLHTFLANKIKIDEVFVKWGVQKDERLFTPSLDTDGRNHLSEWHYVVEPDLKWLATNYPQIKIVIADPFDGVTHDWFDHHKFIQSNHYFGTFEMMRQNCISPTVLANTHLRIAEIWGIDKPSFHLTPDGKASMFFVDSTINVVHHSRSLSTNEFFYYALDMPELPFSQVEHSVRALSTTHARHRWRFDSENKDYIPEAKRRDVWLDAKEMLAKQVLYTKSTAARPRLFQAKKPVQLSKTSRTRDFVYDTHPHSEEYKQWWAKGMNTVEEIIGVNTRSDFMPSIRSRYHVVCDGFLETP